MPAPVRLPRRPARLQLGDHPPGRRSRRGCTSCFGGNTTSLIPLYSVGVFVCFTLSQSGMVRHWFRTRAPGWRWRARVNALRGPADGRRPGHRRHREVLRWRVRGRHPHPAAGRDDAVHPPPVRPVGAPARDQPDVVRRGAADREERAIVPIPELNRAVVQAVNVARSISEQVTAVYITDDPEAAVELRERWQRQVPGVPLVDRRVAVSRSGRARSSPTSTSSTARGRRTSRPRSRSWSCPSTSPAAGGSGSCTTSPRDACAACCSGDPHTVIVGVPYRRDDADRLKRRGPRPWRRRRPSPTTGGRQVDGSPAAADRDRP